MSAIRSSPQPKRSDFADLKTSERADAQQRDVNRVPWMDGKWLRGLDLVVGNLVVRHGLGRQPRGWWTTSRDDTATIMSQPSTWDRDRMTFNSSAPIAADIWVF
jgi:hypothetical protein